MNAMKLLVLVLAAVALLAAQAQADVPAVDEHTVPAVEGKTPWVGIGFTVLFVIGIAAVAFKNPRRTHLD